jgi:hypothetical protein
MRGVPGYIAATVTVVMSYHGAAFTVAGPVVTGVVFVVGKKRSPVGLLDRLRIACGGTENTMPYILDAVRAYATLSEITDVMREEFGTYEEPNFI